MRYQIYERRIGGLGGGRRKEEREKKPKLDM
jgi:hypothetical protein